MADAAQVALTPPAAPVDPGAAFVVHATLTNTGAAAWPAGGATPVRVGSSGPRDNHTWAAGNRWALPADVQPGGTVSLDLNLVAPSAPGTQTFAVELVREFVAWFPGPAVFSCPITVTSVPPPPPPPITVPPARTDPMDLVSFEPFPYFVYPGTNQGDTRLEKTWTNDTGRALQIVKAYLWTGIDFGGTCDTDVEVRRASDGTLVARVAWDHYQNPTAEAGKVFDFAPDCITVAPGESLKLLYLTNFFGGNKNAAHRCEVWVKG